jgi:long-chain fatty acid transport protein
MRTVLVLWLAPSPLFAAAFWGLDHGPSNFARGGANIAAPADPVAVYTNPAAMAALPGLQLQLDANMVFDARRFARAEPQFRADGRRVPGAYPAVQNASAPVPPSPGIFATYQLLEAITLGAGVYGPPRSDLDLPADGPQRYSNIYSHNVQIHYLLGAAWQAPWLKLRIGADLMLVDQIVDTRMKINAPLDLLYNPQLSEEQKYDIDVQAHATDKKIPGAVLGISLEPLPHVTVALVYQTPYDAEASGTAKITLGEAYQESAEVHGDRIDVRLKMPGIARAARRYDGDGWDVEAALVYETWKRNRVIEFAPQDVVIVSDQLAGPQAIGVVPIDNGLHDAYSLRLGGSYQWLDWLQLRLGTYYERSPVPEERLAAGSFDLDKVGGTAGARIDLPWGLWTDLAFGYTAWFKKTVRNSEVMLVNPVYEAMPTHPIANGTYDNRQITLMAALGLRL